MYQSSVKLDLAKQTYSCESFLKVIVAYCPPAKLFKSQFTVLASVRPRTTIIRSVNTSLPLILLDWILNPSDNY